MSKMSLGLLDSMDRFSLDPERGAWRQEDKTSRRAGSKAAAATRG
jgi:hypothetical protein